MQPFKLEELIQFLKPKKVLGESTADISHYSIDSRTIGRGDLYFAIKGEKFDGHDFIQESLQKGARGIIYSRDLDVLPGKGQFALQVDDTCRAFQDLACQNRLKLKTKIIGITGSNGKTTTKEWVSQLTALREKTHKTYGTENNHIGVPITLLGLNPFHGVAVIEMGMSDLGEIERLAQIARPNIGIVTSIAASHLEKLGNIENVYRAKLELAKQINSTKGILLLNGDDPWVVKMAGEVSCPVILFGTHTDFGYFATDIGHNRDGAVSFKLNVPAENFKETIHLPHLGRHNVFNCLASIAAAHQLGGDLLDIAKACSTLRAPAMRLEKIEKEGVTYINDAYNANPTSMEVALNVLEEIESQGKKIFVCGDMMELGLISEMAHQQLGEKVYDSKIDILITYGHLSRSTAEKAIECGMNEKDVFICYEKDAIPSIIKDVATPGDVVLLKGSRRNQLENILSDWRQEDQKAAVES